MNEMKLIISFLIFYRSNFISIINGSRISLQIQEDSSFFTPRTEVSLVLFTYEVVFLGSRLCFGTVQVDDCSFSYGCWWVVGSPSWLNYWQKINFKRYTEVHLLFYSNVFLASCCAELVYDSGSLEQEEVRSLSQSNSFQPLKHEWRSFAWIVASPSVLGTIWHAKCLWNWRHFKNIEIFSRWQTQLQRCDDGGFDWSSKDRNHSNLPRRNHQRMSLRHQSQTRSIQASITSSTSCNQILLIHAYGMAMWKWNTTSTWLIN